MLPLHTTRVVGRFRSTILLAFFLFGVQSIFAQIPTGYYTSAIGTGATLKTALYNIIKGHTVKSYDYIWTAYYTTDVRSDGKVWDMYSDIPGGTPPMSLRLDPGNVVPVEFLQRDNVTAVNIPSRKAGLEEKCRRCTRIFFTYTLRINTSITEGATILTEK